MNAAAAVMFAGAACIWLGIPAYLLGVIVRDRLTPPPSPVAELEVTPEWLAVLAAVEPTPVYDRLVCEQIERREWAS